MKLRFLKTCGLLLLSLLLIAAVADVFAQQDPAKAGVAPALEGAQSSADDSNFAYSPKGRRDPFKPLIQKKQIIVKKAAGPAKPSRIKGPLEKFELSQYRLVALMVVKGIPRAMLKAPDGKGYTIKVGEYIGMNDGIIKKIETKVVDIDKNGLRVEKSPDRIVVEEVGVDNYTGKVLRENRYITM